jgi:hypothetical protein
VAGSGDDVGCRDDRFRCANAVPGVVDEDGVCVVDVDVTSAIRTGGVGGSSWGEHY